MTERRRTARAMMWVLGGPRDGGSMRYERMGVALVALVGMTVLGMTGHVDAQAVTGLYSAVVGYMLGHGAGAAAERRSNDRG